MTWRKRTIMEMALDAFGEIAWSNETQWQRDRAKEAITAIKEALAQPDHCLDCGQKLGDANHIHTCSPQRKPLTDEEIVAINDKYYNLAYRDFEADVAIARAIEAAHDIKENT